MTHVWCPHCHNPLPAVEPAAALLLCPSCRSPLPPPPAQPTALLDRVFADFAGPALPDGAEAAPAGPDPEAAALCNRRGTGHAARGDYKRAAWPVPRRL